MNFRISGSSWGITAMRGCMVQSIRIVARQRCLSRYMASANCLNQDGSQNGRSSSVVGTVYDVWQKASQPETPSATQSPTEAIGDSRRTPAAQVKGDVPVGDLGSGSDYTGFLQHLGVPSSDISSSGPYGVYHSVFDNFNWFKKFGDPDFVYEQEMARVLGLEAVRMADADVLPYDYEEYGKEVVAYLDAAHKRAESKFGAHSIDFDAVNAAARRFETAGAKLLAKQKNPAA